MSTFASDTSKRSLKNWIIALSILLLGLIIAHLGISLFYYPSLVLIPSLYLFKDLLEHLIYL